MPTRGYLELPVQRGEVFTAALESCKDLGADVRNNADESSCTVEGKIPSDWMKNRSGSDFMIVVDGNEGGGSLLSIYDIFAVAPDKRFIDAFFAAFDKHVPLGGDYQVETVGGQIVKVGEELQQQQQQTTSSTQNQIGLNPLYGEVQKQELPFDLGAVKKYEYKIKATGYAGFPQLKDAEKMCIFPIEVGSEIQFTDRHDLPLLDIGMGSIVSVGTKAIGKGDSRKKDNAVIEIVVEAAESEKRTLEIDVEDRRVPEIVDHLNQGKDLEKDYWARFDLSFTYDDASETRTSAIYYKTPFLAKDEDLLWSFVKTEGIFHKRIYALAALTSFRVFLYLFDTHECGRAILTTIDDVIVTDPKRTTESYSSGTYTGISFGHTSTGSYSGNSTSTSQTIGKVVFMSDGKDILTFGPIADPDGVVKLAKAAIRQVKLVGPPLQALDAAKAPAGQNAGGAVCPDCGNSNPLSAKFCNKCGAKIDCSCPNCGNHNPKNSSFCNKCGLTLK